MINLVYSELIKYDETHLFSDESRNIRLTKDIKLEKVRQEIFTSGILIESIMPETSSVAYKDDGKPFFVGSNRCFNVTHSDGIVICGYSDNFDLGIDYEKKSRRLRSSISKKLCSPDEAIYLDRIDEADKLLYLVKLFTIKEAISKLTGHGLRMDFSKIKVDDMTGFLEEDCITLTDEKSNVYAVKTIDFLDGYLSIALSIKNINELNDININELKIEG